MAKVRFRCKRYHEPNAALPAAKERKTIFVFEAPLDG